MQVSNMADFILVRFNILTLLIVEETKTST